MTERVEPPFSRPLLSVANADDAELACTATFPRIAAASDRASVVHVIEKAGGAPDKTSVEQREEVADELFDVVRRAADDAGIDLHTDLRSATDVGDAILEAAIEADATAIVFTPRGGRSWWDLFSGAVCDQLVRHNDRPVAVLPAGVDDNGDARGET